MGVTSLSQFSACILILLSMTSAGAAEEIDPPTVPIFNWNWTVVPEPVNTDKDQVAVGGCVASATPITLTAGQYSVFTSPNYPENYNWSSNCAWTFQTAAANRLMLQCLEPEFAFFANFRYTDNGTETQRFCIFFCNDDIEHKFEGTTAEIVFTSWILFAAKGFQCRIEAVDRNEARDCGVPGVNNTLIVGGTEVTQHAYPWMAVLVTADSLRFFCGGSLITNKHVLTAAHCTENALPSQIKVRLGVHQRSLTAPGEIVADILEIVIHPSWNRENLVYDASIITIDVVDFAANPTIGPLCITDGADQFVGSTGVTAGWGRITAGGSTSDVLLEVSLSVLSDAVCEELYANIDLPGDSFSPTWVCAGGEAGLGSCNGDSGGPLSVQMPEGYFSVIGITSFGIPCALEGYPTFYARITTFSEWIRGASFMSNDFYPPTTQ